VTAVEPTTEPTDNRSRRDVLCGLVVALLAPGALAAACGNDTSSNSGSAPTGGGSTSGGGSSGGAGTKLAALADVPQGSGLVVNKPGGGKLLLVRSAADDVKAFNAACKHKGTIVDPPKNGTITCPAHGSQYDAATGSLKKGPATAGLDAVSVKVQGTDVVLA
jgi:cytochrome b6-f complex iron-sulfur subunit